MHGHAFLCLYPQLLLMQTKNEEKQPHWVVSREEVEVTDELLGSGGWAKVKIANKFCGLRVAAKSLCWVISVTCDYNILQFTREMKIATKFCHPNFLLFIGATREGEPVIFTELMPTSLRKELEKRDAYISDIIQSRCGSCSALQGRRQKKIWGFPKWCKQNSRGCGGHKLSRRWGVYPIFALLSWQFLLTKVSVKLIMVIYNLCKESDQEPIRSDKPNYCLYTDLPSFWLVVEVKCWL